jgi:signal transduction histidine kinase
MPAPAPSNNVPAEILIVDDSRDELQVLDEFLRAQGHKTRLAPSGQDALEMARAHPPDLLLLDANMPDMNGYDVCERLRVERGLREIPIIFLSALVAVSDKLRAFRAGAVDYIAKPFELEEVVARVRTQLELRRQRRALEANFVRLQELKQLRDNLVDMIVHDLRSSLTSIGLSLALLEQSLRPAARRHRSLVRTALADVRRQGSMATQLQDIGRLEAGQMPLHQQESDLVKTAAAAIELAATLEDRAQWQLEAAEPVIAFHDVEIIGRVIGNLLSNAVKFTPEGSELKIAVAREGAFARVSVTDSGPWIPAENQQKIFEKFAQLAFCKLAVQAHAGQIGVLSKPGHGSTFWFTLPSRGAKCNCNIC